jgi:ABC-2 type transport system permease protein
VDDTHDEAERLMRAGEVDAIVRVPVDFSRRLAAGDARMQLLLNGVDRTPRRPSRATSTAPSLPGRKRRLTALATNPAGARGGGAAHVVQRSRQQHLVSGAGLIVLVLTLIGAFLTSLLIAREWERGTLESLFVTPVRPLEIVLRQARALPGGRCHRPGAVPAGGAFLFEVPMRGSLWVIVFASLLVPDGIAAAGAVHLRQDAQPVPGEPGGPAGQLHAGMMLSGFIFDLRNVPVVVQVVSQLLPATHFMG